MVPVGAPIASGHAHSCLLAGGTVWCWGENTYGQLGDGTTGNRNVPTAVLGLPPNIRAVAAGWGHTCALTAEGGVKCWGYNHNGELGNGSTVDSLLPVDVSGLSANVMALAAGDDHTCALTGRGGVACWGFNETGQLGDGTTVNSIVPTMVINFNSRVTAVTAGWGHTCARMENGGLKCWGDNEFGQLGTGSIHNLEAAPVNVYGLTFGVRAVSAAGGQTCALLSTTGVKCWGNNKYGQLGDGTSTTRSLPVYVHGLDTGASAIAVGWNHSCALSLSGGVLCWGWNYYGQLGDGTSTTRTFPVNVSGLDGRAADISMGFDFTCAQNGDHRIHCWGKGEAGQLGNGGNGASSHPQDVAQTGYEFSEVLPSTEFHTDNATGMPETPTATRTQEPLAESLDLRRSIAAGLAGGVSSRHRDRIPSGEMSETARTIARAVISSFWSCLYGK